MILLIQQFTEDYHTKQPVKSPTKNSGGSLIIYSALQVFLSRSRLRDKK